MSGEEYWSERKQVSSIVEIQNVVNKTPHKNVIIFMYRMNNVPDAVSLLETIGTEYALQEVGKVLTVTLVYSGVLCVILGDLLPDEKIAEIVKFYGDGEKYPSMRNLMEYNRELTFNPSVLSHIDTSIAVSNEAIEIALRSLKIHYQRKQELKAEKDRILGLSGSILEDFDDGFTSPLVVIDNYAIWDTPPTQNNLKPSHNITEVNDVHMLYLLMKASMVELSERDYSNNDYEIDDYESDIEDFREYGMPFHTPRLLSVIDMSNSNAGEAVNWITHNRTVEGQPLPHMIYGGMGSDTYTRACLGNQVDVFTNAIREYNIGSLKGAVLTFNTSVNMNDSVGEDFIHYNPANIHPETVIEHVQLREIPEPEPDSIDDVTEDADMNENDKDVRQVWDSLFTDDSEN